MTTIRTTFDKIWVEATKKYVCSNCGHKFTRKNRDWFTMSPFNKMTKEDCYKTNKDIVNARIRECPKCQADVSPKT